MKDDFTLISFQRPISSEVITRSPSQFFRGSHLNMDLANVQPKRSYRQPFAEVKSRKNHCWWATIFLNQVSGHSVTGVLLNPCAKPALIEFFLVGKNTSAESEQQDPWLPGQVCELTGLVN